MKNYDKYERQYFMPPKVTYDWVKKDYLDHPPLWCSVDLRDGNQALIEPMSLEEKLEFFRMLVELGFKQIEIGFPAASETEFEFARRLIERKMIPDDVTVQVLTQARPHIIKKTFEAVKGAPHAIIHLYNSTSVAQREQVFKKNKQDIKKIAIEGAQLLDKLAKETQGNFSFQYSPESFSGTEVDYAVEVCNAVLDVWKPKKSNKVIINIPTTVENAMPHVFAAQVEYIHKSLKYRDAVCLSVHPHNDRGSGVATAEMAVLAGADRVEGTLFGNGERTGNVDIVTLALNLFSHGVDPLLDFSYLPKIGEAYERLTRMQINPRQPYAGSLVFTAFSGSHQDAISKGFTWHDKHKKEKWCVPYLPIDPKDIGREYDGDVIRINSQSGSGGVSYILKEGFGLLVPKDMQSDLSYAIKDISDREHAELSPDRIYQVFNDRYVHNYDVFEVIDTHFKKDDGIFASVVIEHNDKEITIGALGNGRLDAVSNAIKDYFRVEYDLISYEEHALSSGTTSKAVSYVGVSYKAHTYWGVGIDEDIIKSSIDALASAVNQLEEVRARGVERDRRITQINNYIQEHYLTVTLDDLSEKFFLSKPYLSKYIKEKSGMTFGENVKRIRMKKASHLLRNGNMKIERIAEAIGYQNVEHFNRVFKGVYGMTPVQYRTEVEG